MVDASRVADRYAAGVIKKRAILERLVQLFLPREWKENQLAQLARWVNETDEKGKLKSADALKADRRKAVEFLKENLKLTGEQAQKIVSGPDAQTLVENYARLVTQLRQRGAVSAHKGETAEDAEVRRKAKVCLERLQANLWWSQDQVRFAINELMKGRRLTPIMVEILEQAARFAWKPEEAKEFSKALEKLTAK